MVDIGGAFYSRKAVELWPKNAGATVGATAVNAG